MMQNNPIKRPKAPLGIQLTETSTTASKTLPGIPRRSEPDLPPAFVLQAQAAALAPVPLQPGQASAPVSLAQPPISYSY